MSWGPFEHLNIYLPYGLRKLGFKNTIGNRPLLSPKNFYHGWMVDGGWWMESFFFFFFLDTYIRYSTCIGIYIYLYNFVWNKSLMGFKIWSSWGVGHFIFKITLFRTVFVFLSLKLVFALVIVVWVKYLCFFFFEKGEEKIQK